MRHPRVRFTVRRMMVAVAVLAAAFAAVAGWMKFDPSGWRHHLNEEMTWCRSPESAFHSKDIGIIWVHANSLLKVSEVGVRHPWGYYDQHRWCLGPGGELLDRRAGSKATGWGDPGGQHELTAAELAQVQQLLAVLPPSNGSHSQGELLLVSSLSEGSWVTKVYDKSALPSAVRDLVTVLHLSLR